MRLRAVVGGVGLVVVALVLLATPAGAQAGGCTATAQGLDVRGFDTPSKALKVKKTEVLRITSTAPSSGEYDVKLEFGGFQWRAASDSYDGTSWADDVAVDEYAKHGIGIYKVIAVSRMTSGGSCSVTAYVNVTGGSPLGTTAGIVSTAVAGVGLIGTMGAAIASGRPRTFSEGEVKGGVMDFIEEQAHGGKKPERFKPITDQDFKNIKAVRAQVCGGPGDLFLVVVATAAALTSDTAQHVLSIVRTKR